MSIKYLRDDMNLLFQLSTGWRLVTNFLCCHTIYIIFSSLLISIYMYNFHEVWCLLM